MPTQNITENNNVKAYNINKNGENYNIGIDQNNYRVNNNKQVNGDVGVNKISYNSNIKDYLSKNTTQNNQNKNNYQLSYKVGDTAQQKKQEQQFVSNQNTPTPIKDGNQLVNNIYPNLPQQNDYAMDDKRYVGSGFEDIIRDLFNDVKNSKIEQYKLLQEMENASTKISLSEEPKKGIDAAEKEQKKVKKIKDYKDMSDDFAILVTRLFKNSNEEGKISITDYKEFLDGPVSNLKKKIKETLEAKGSKDDSTKEVPNPLKQFLNKADDELVIMENNNNISFDPNNMRKLCVELDMDLSDAYENITVFEIILMAIYNFFYGDFYQENKTARKEIDGMLDLINSFYELPVEQRAKTIKDMHEKVAKIEFILGNTITTKQRDWKNLQEIKKGLKDAGSIEVDSVKVVFDLIKSFGQEVIKNAGIKASNYSAYRQLYKKISEYIKKNTGCSTKMSEDIANHFLTGGKKDALNIKNNRIINVLFDGQISEKRKQMTDELNNVNNREDVKIEAYSNLKAADIVCKTADMIKKAINNYVNKFQEQLEQVIGSRSAQLGGVDNANFSEYFKFINNARKSIIENIKMFANGYKGSVFAYEDDNAKRKKNIEKGKEDLTKLKNKIQKLLDDQFFEKDAKTKKPTIEKSGKAKDIQQLKGFLDEDEGVCNITGLKYDKWEDIDNTIKDLEKQLENLCNIEMQPKNGKSLIDVIADENKIKYQTQNDLINKAIFDRPYGGHMRGGGGY